MYGLIGNAVAAATAEMVRNGRDHWYIVVLAYAGAVNVLVLILWWVIRRWVGGIDTWRTEASKAGGFVTREQYFNWCGPQQARCREDLTCRLEGLEDWRRGVMEKGGALSFHEHMAICDKLSEKSAANFAKRTDELMKHHRELVESQFAAFSERIEKRIVESFAEMRKEFHRNPEK
jgi:hypothetical protein